MTDPDPSGHFAESSDNSAIDSPTVISPASEESAADEFSTYERVIPRLLRNMVVASILLLGPAWWFGGRTEAIGFVFGAFVSYINFRSLKRGVEGLADRIVNRDSREKGGLIILRFVVRYGLVAGAAYAIFISSASAFRGFLWGLCVPVAALMAEAIWEGYLAFRRS
jgi:hypothetical protein